MPTQPYTNGKLARDIGVLCLITACLSLTLAYRWQLDNVKDTIVRRCEARQTYDDASNALRDEMSLRFREFATQEEHNPFIDDTLRKKRVTAWNALADKADTTIAAQVKGSCQDYR